MILVSIKDRDLWSVPIFEHAQIIIILIIIFYLAHLEVLTIDLHTLYILDDRTFIVR